MDKAELMKAVGLCFCRLLNSKSSGLYHGHVTVLDTQSWLISVLALGLNIL